MKLRKQSSTTYPITFLMVDSSDHLTGKTGLTPTVTISKNGAGFGAPSGAVSEVGNGWYALAGNATDRGTLGDLLIHATGTGADPVDDRYTIVPWDPFDATSLGVTRLDAAITSRLAPTTSGRTLDVTTGGNAGIDWANVANADATVELSDTIIYGVDHAFLDAGTITASSFFPGAITASAIATGAIDADALAADAIAEIAAAISPVIGSGAITHTITVNDGVNPLEGVEVWITTDVGGTNVVAGTATTDSLGHVTFYLDAGTYYAWQQLTGYTFTNPTAITVA